LTRTAYSCVAGLLATLLPMPKTNLCRYVNITCINNLRCIIAECLFSLFHIDYFSFSNFRFYFGYFQRVICWPKDAVMQTFFNFYRAMLAQSAVMRLHVVCLSVCLSVC